MQEGYSSEMMWLVDYLNGEQDADLGLEGRENRIDEIYGYWTLSAYSESYDCAYTLNHLLQIGMSYDAFLYASEPIGVRPVITLEI